MIFEIKMEYISCVEGTAVEMFYVERMSKCDLSYKKVYYRISYI